VTFGSGRVGAEHFKDSGIKSGRSATIFFIWEYRIAQKAWFDVDNHLQQASKVFQTHL